MTAPLISIRKLDMAFPATAKGLKVLHDINLDVLPGETLGLVGESGCGKTTLGRCLMRVYRPVNGEIHYRTPAGGTVDLAQLSERALTPFRHDLRMVFQDPWSSLNPRMTVFDIVAEPLVNASVKVARSEMEDRVADMLRRVGLRPELMSRYPYAFSGGQRQRIGIARALVVRPRLVIADEAVSALDVSVRAQILNLLNELKQDLDLTFVFISHDLGVVRHICDRVAVMYAGEIMEVAETGQLFEQPRHPYTEALMAAVPLPDPHRRGERKRLLKGEVPDPARRPEGCVFHPRCGFAVEACQTTPPMLAEDANGSIRCIRAASLELNGVAHGR
jgi:peptide/nickel transport system ATP-binding protein